MEELNSGTIWVLACDTVWLRVLKYRDHFWTDRRKDRGDLSKGYPGVFVPSVEGDAFPKYQ